MNFGPPEMAARCTQDSSRRQSGCPSSPVGSTFAHHRRSASDDRRASFHADSKKPAEGFRAGFDFCSQSFQRINLDSAISASLMPVEPHPLSLGLLLWGRDAGEHVRHNCISCAMLAWAARYPHLSAWVNTGLRPRRPKRPQQNFGWEAFT